MVHKFLLFLALSSSSLAGAGEPPMPSHHWQFDGNAIDEVSGIEGSGSVGYSSNRIQGSSSLQLMDTTKLHFGSHLLRDSFELYSVSLWFWAESIDGYQYIYEEGGRGSGLAVRLHNGNLQAAIRAGGDEPFAQVGPVSPGRWYHASATFSSGVLGITMNGSLSQSMDTKIASIGQHNNAASIGGSGLSHTPSDATFVGLVDDLRIWDGYALNDSEISTLWRENRPERPNILLIVADDMNYDSPGFMGGVAPNVTPNLDRLASESLVFDLAHAANSVCQPSRQAMLSGKYPPTYGSVGFNPMAEGTPTVVSSLVASGYLTANFHKVHHMRPYSSFPWNMTEKNTDLEGRERRDDNRGDKTIGRAPNMLAKATRKTIETARDAEVPFFLVINSADPHRPFHGTNSQEKRKVYQQVEEPSQLFTPDEVTVPNPLPDLPGVRLDVSQYAASVRRLDDTVGRCLEVLEEEGVTNNTVVMFVSDNGMPMPWGKVETYRDSLHGPLTIRWPGRVAPRRDSTHLVSLTDIAPTIVDISHAFSLENVDGRSLRPFMDGETNVAWRDIVVGTRYEDIQYASGLDRSGNGDEKRERLREEGWVDSHYSHSEGSMIREMNKRGITDGTYHYIYNHFYDPDIMIKAYAYSSDASFAAFEEASLTNETLAERFHFYTYRAPHELYHTKTDPGSRNNLIDDSDSVSHACRLQRKLLDWMMETNDPVRDDFAAFLDTSECPE